MPFLPVEDLSDPRLNPYRQLPSSRREQRERVFIAEGHWLVERLWTSSHEVVSVLISRERVGDLPQDLVEKVPVYVVTKGELAEVVGYDFHRGVLACGRRRAVPGVRESRDRLSLEAATLLVADGVVDPENLGSLLRNAAAFGVHGVILGPGCADPFSRRVLRVSMGNVLRIPLMQSDNLASDLRFLRSELGYRAYATVLDPAATPIWEVPRPAKLIWVLGSEGHGISTETIRECDCQVTIPMQGGTDSLNVATAAALFLYDFEVRRRFA